METLTCRVQDVTRRVEVMPLVKSLELSDVAHRTVGWKTPPKESLPPRTSLISDWSRLKASLPVSSGGLSLRQSTLHAPAAYVSSIVETLPLVSEVLSSDSLPAGFDHSISSLAEAAHQPDWVARESIDIPIHQRLLSKCIDDVSFSHLLSLAPDSR